MRIMTEDAIDRIVHEWNRERPDLDVSVTHVLQRITRLYLLQSASFAEVFNRYGLTFGEYDTIAICEFPDDVSAAAFSLAASAGGACKTFRTTPLLTVADGVEAMKKAGGASYEPPG